MTKPKGGRGVTAPYETKLMRVPVPLAAQVSELVERYQNAIESGSDPLNPPVLLDAKPVNELEASAEKLYSDLESARDRILSRWKLQKRAESKDRIREALDKLIAELRSQLG